MRLTEFEINAIKKAFYEYFSNQDHLWLFGSRVKNEKRGGDIDLYIETTETNTTLLVKKRMKFNVRLWELLGDQKIDIVVNPIKLNQPLVIYKIAKETGIQLI